MSSNGGNRPPSTFFQNQPPYTHFNKSFEDPSDALFCHLNEVHPVFMTPEHQANDYIFEMLLDPRTKKEVDHIFYDYSSGVKQRVGHFPILLPSNMTKVEHTVGLRVIEAWQEYKEVNEQDVIQWRQLESARMKDKTTFDKCVMDFSNTQKESIYAPCERLVRLYKQLYTAKLTKLLEAYPENLALNTCVGLPHPQSFKASRTEYLQMENVRMVKHQGWVPVLGNYINEMQRFNLRIENYMDYYINNIKSILPDDITCHTNKEAKKPAHQIHIPLESLLFLLTTGSSADLPTEVPLEISESGVENSKVVKFEEPLPPRVCGWFAHKQVVENAFETLLSRNNDTQWLYMDNYVAEQEKTEETAEIRAVDYTERHFRAYKIEQYLEKISTKEEECVKTNYAVIEWHLNGKIDELNTAQLQFFTQLKMSPSNDEYGVQLLSSHSIKLEYKPQFGAEQMTKYELIKEWFRVKLFGQCKGFSDYAICLRVAVHDFSQQLTHKLMLANIEKQLAEVHQVDMPKLLTGLADTLNLLAKIPTGKYFLRFSAKFPNKLLLSAPTNEITSNTVFLHSLTKVKPSDLVFMTEVQHLPIVDSLCTALHKQHKIMPCALKPQLTRQSQTKVFGKILSDEEFVQRRMRAKLESEKKKIEERSKSIKSRRKKVKARKAKQRRKRRMEEAANEEAIEKFINEF
ncbi:little elongation complex subunit 2 [Zeugodacus cucurbitae]|uniref:little elongation complex subunit 2 n=1 Tax=Zeugodacus cucurbitae TaxID=28588 RepID=UPI000596902C|nr:little elongation complex subunit 2 [Zeugodacus cucurbitae]